MGREVRRVPADWKHPIDEARGRPKPLYDRSFAAAAAEWDREHAEWQAGKRPSYWEDDGTDETRQFDQWHGERPCSANYMPDWPAEQRTHYQMYEDTSEGTPISPVFATPEEVARYCADHGVSIFGSCTASYEEWLIIARGGCSPGLVMDLGANTIQPMIVGDK